MMKNYHKPMYQAIQRLVTEYDFSLEDADTIELFARTGEWQTIVYAPYVKSLEAWEIDQAFYEDLKKNLPNANIKIVDTWKEIKNITKKYDLIVVDAPQSIYGEHDEHCEHFGLLSDVFRIAKDSCAIILTINLNPYDFHKNSRWWVERSKYYKTEHPEQLSFSLVEQCYRNICKENNRVLEGCFFQKRHKILHYFVMKIITQRPVNTK